MSDNLPQEPRTHIERLEQALASGRTEMTLEEMLADREILQLEILHDLPDNLPPVRRSLWNIAAICAAFLLITFAVVATGATVLVAAKTAYQVAHPHTEETR